MCSGRQIIWALLVFSVMEMVLGVSGVLLGVLATAQQHQASNRMTLADTAPIWSGACVRSVQLQVVLSKGGGEDITII